jgi:hypothetical protein
MCGLVWYFVNFPCFSNEFTFLSVILKFLWLFGVFEGYRGSSAFLQKLYANIGAHVGTMLSLCDKAYWKSYTRIWRRYVMEVEMQENS